MYDEQTRINATISYLFLGPIFLLAKKGTPLAEKYVQDHARRASLLIAASIGVYISYYFIQDILSVSLFGISLSSLVLSLVVTAILAILLHGAYFAFSWKEAKELRLGELFFLNNWGKGILENQRTDASGYTDEEKIRIVASFLPFIGIWLSSRYNKNEIRIGGKVWSFGLAIIMIVTILTESTGLAVLLSLIYISIIVITLVGLFVQKQFFSLWFYQYIPTYHEFEAHMFASVRYLFMFIRVIFWGQKNFFYQDLYNQTLSNNTEKWATPEEWWNSYFIPLWIIGIPVLNLITLPSYWNQSYRQYRSLILQGISLSMLFVCIWLLYGWNSSIQGLLLFPIMHLLSYAPRNTNTLAPIVSLSISLTKILSRSQSALSENITKKEEKVSFNYETGTPDSKETESKIANL